ncbi:tRNA 2-thiocytidine(32) synthetase TtcA [bacterium]|nr:tRNA 2-thiocytidine(32) synthetase TtcA [candidate division CSSED10-310 bacterium]
MKISNTFGDKPDRYIRHTVGKTIADYSLINENDRILVCFSGGKDSWILLHSLSYLKKVSPVPFSLIPAIVHPGFERFNVDPAVKYLKQFSITLNVIKTTIEKTVINSNSKGKNPCALCARLRRGALTRFAKKQCCNIIALGHHADDAIETVLLSAFFQGKFCSLPPKYTTGDSALRVIRPLIRIWENDIQKYVQTTDFPIIQCPEEEWNTHQKRKYIKHLLTVINTETPVAKKNLLSAVQNIEPSHFLDRRWL